MQVERATDTGVFIMGRRRAFKSRFDIYAKTWEEARDWLLEKATVRVQLARRELELANSHLGNVKGMRP